MALVACAGERAWAEETADAPDAGSVPPQSAAMSKEAVTALKAEATPKDEVPGWLKRTTFFGYAKVGFYYVFASNQDSLIGQNSGFRVANVRLGTSIQPADSLEVVASIDGSVIKRKEADPLNGSRVVELKDAYIERKVKDFFLVRLGQFKVPFNAESMLGDGLLPFASRSIISDGVLPPEGYPREGLALDRDIGVMLHSKRVGTDFVGFKWAIAVVNGAGANQINNDNNSVTPVGRVSVDFLQKVSFGINGYSDEHTVGERPLQVTENRVGVGADAALEVAGFSALFSALQRNTSHPTTGLPSERGLGLVGSVGYVHGSTGFEGGVRYANYDPSNVQAHDRLYEIAIMLGRRITWIPSRVIVQYTIRGEEPAVSIDNNSLDALFQISY